MLTLHELNAALLLIHQRVTSKYREIRWLIILLPWSRGTWYHTLIDLCISDVRIVPKAQNEYIIMFIITFNIWTNGLVEGRGEWVLDNLLNFIYLWMAAPSRCVSHMQYSHSHLHTCKCMYIARIHAHTHRCIFLLYEEHRIKEEGVKACQEYFWSLLFCCWI